MTDKKTIQEALAEVQRNVELNEFATNPPKFSAGKAGLVGLAAAGIGAAASSDAAHKIYQKGKETVDKLKRAQLPPVVKDYLNTPVKYDPDKPTMGTKTSSGHPENEPASSVFSRIKSGQSPASTPATSGKTEPASSKPAETKTETKPADKPVAYDKNKYAIYAKDSDSAKSFRDTFAAQKAAGADTFKWKGGDEVERTYSTKSAPEPKKTESESGGKKKMSEENINETAFGSAFAAARKAGKTNFSFGGKSFNTKLASSSPAKPAGPQGAPGLVGPGARVTRLDAPLPPSRPNPQGPRQPAEQGPPIPKTDKVPGSSTGDTTPRTSTTPPINQTQQKPLQPVDTSSMGATKLTGPEDQGPTNARWYGDRNNIPGNPGESKNPEEQESGGKKKKMSEETNPLIAAFLKLQSENPQNMFEAAKKAKKDYDGDGKVESEKDEVWGSRFKAARAAGKMEEANIDPVVTGSSSVTKDPKKYVDPSTPTVPMSELPKTGNAAGDVLDKAKGALDKKGVREEAEEITFSQAEIDHINSFFLEASVAPTRPEVATGADSTSDKMSQNDVTGTHTESGKRKVKEEVEQIEEGRPKKNPTPETTERDPRQHIQVIAGRAAAGSVVDFPHNDGTKSKITPNMGRRITAHLNGLKPADRQSAVNKMHASAEGLKV